MAARSIASLTVSFGLVSIPVKLYSATQARASISFNLLHAKDGSRLRQQYVCIKEDVVVERDEMIKGYEFAKDQYVTFTADELKALEEESTGTVEITEFVPDEKIDPIYYDKAYYLAPDKGGAKPYALLSEGMRSTGRCALARWAARGKQYLVQLRPVADGLMMQQLLYSDEVRPMSEIEIQHSPVKEAELKLAVQLIDQISADEFNPKAYEDDVKKRIEAAVEKKISGKEISVSPAAPTGKGAQVIDLMEALRASLNKGTPKPEQAERKPPKRAAAAARPAKAKAARR
ncbi:MAG TPA: Ku protein [Burkholderiales bacterium]|jgi:DNA end-binding protein Ku|nr:Ku protein [Burkholderiales bacterium]